MATNETNEGGKGKKTEYDPAKDVQLFCIGEDLDLTPEKPAGEKVFFVVSVHSYNGNSPMLRFWKFGEKGAGWESDRIGRLDMATAARVAIAAAAFVQAPVNLAADRLMANAATVKAAQDEGNVLILNIDALPVLAWNGPAELVSIVEGRAGKGPSGPPAPKHGGLSPEAASEAIKIAEAVPQAVVDAAAAKLKKELGLNGKGKAPASGKAKGAPARP